MPPWPRKVQHEELDHFFKEKELETESALEYGIRQVWSGDKLVSVNAKNAVLCRSSSG